MRIVLGSQSPRRKKLLNDAGYVIEVLPAYFDEESLRHDDPRALTNMLAMAKNKVLREKVSGAPCIVTADTVVTFEGNIYEKAQSEHEAYEWITMFMGKHIDVYTSHVIFDVETGYEATHTAEASVSFSEIPEETRKQLAVNAYNASVAGGFNMTDPLLHPFATMHGDESTIVGLDIAWVRETLIHIEKLHARSTLKKIYTSRDLSLYVRSACAIVEADARFQTAERVYAYHPMSTLEIPFIDILRNKYQNKQWVFPEVTAETMSFTDAESPVMHSYMLVPALAVTPRGVRLGKGKGMYDKYLTTHPELRTVTCAVVPDFALVPELPATTHDVPLETVHGVSAQ